MVNQGLFDRIKGNPLSKVSPDELKAEEMRLENRLGTVEKEIDGLEKKKQQKFNEGVGASQLKKQTLISQMNSMDVQAKLNYVQFEQINGRLSFARNLRIIMDFEKQIRNTGVWKRLSSVPREVLEERLIKIRLQGKTAQDIINELNRQFGMDVADVGQVAMEEGKELFDAWKSVEAGGMTPEDAYKPHSIPNKVVKESAS